MSAPYDRPTNEPGGMECMECGVIFVGAEWHSRCAVCEAKHQEVRPMTTLTDRARELRNRVVWSSNESIEAIEQALVAAEKRGAAREREELAALYDAAADELDKQSVDALSVGEKLRLDETAKKHRDFAAYLRNRESDT